jgi:hypothetical protein
MDLITLKRYTKKACKQIEVSAKNNQWEEMNHALISKRMAGSIRSLQKINAKEPYNSLSSVGNIIKKWGKL